MRVLVTGGAGYIGSVITDQLVAGGHRVVVLDNLSKGHRDAVNEHATFVHGDLVDAAIVKHTLASNSIEAVVHMAASSLVGESMASPGRYYTNNVAAGITLLNALVEANVGTFVFSSTAAVYGEPASVPIGEDAPTNPTNTYGETKLAIERALHWYHAAHGLRYASLRYFNAAGATSGVASATIPKHISSRWCCERREIKRTRSRYSAATTRRPTARACATTSMCRISPTPTCVRSQRSRRGSCVRTSSTSDAATDWTVQEIIDAARAVTGRDIPLREGAGVRAIRRRSSRALRASRRPSGGSLDTARSRTSSARRGSGSNASRRRQVFRGTLRRVRESGTRVGVPMSLAKTAAALANRRISDASASGRQGFRRKRSHPLASASSRSAPKAAPVSMMMRVGLVRASSRSRRASSNPSICPLRRRSVTSTAGAT